MPRISFEKIEKNSAEKLIELKAAASASKDVELKAKLDTCKSLANTIGKDAAAAAAAKVLADWTDANPSAVAISPSEVLAIKAAVTSISTAAPIAASHSQLLRSDLDKVKAMSITPLRLVHGLLQDFLALSVGERGRKLDKWREFALVNRDYSAENVLRVAGLLPTDEKPATEDEKPKQGTTKKK